MTRQLLLACVAMSTILTTVSAAPLGTAFTYQGQLQKDGQRVNAACDFEFSLWDDPTNGNPIGQPVLKPAQQVTEGLFTVTLDFGEGAINGEARWLEITVQCPDDATATALSPRQALTPAPHALRAVTGVGGPNALNVSPSGDVGIGTTSPAAHLDVNCATRTTTLEITGGSPLGETLVGWGWNNEGQIDILPESGTFIAVAAGYEYTLAIRTDGTLVGWGNNNVGQIDVPAGTFTTVASQENDSLAIRTDGTLVGWGQDSYGQTGVPTGTFAAIAVGGGGHSLAMALDGTLVGWGYNYYGQTNVPSGTFIAVAAGINHGLAIRDDGNLAAWGDNSFSQIEVPSGTFVAVAACGNHNLAIRTDGTLAGWGDNNYGQTDVPLGTFLAVATGRYHSLGIRVDGSLIGWGSNDQGRTDVPWGIFSAVAAGGVHSLAIRSTSGGIPPALRLYSEAAYKPGSDRWTIFSDRRLKKNIEPLSDALDHLLQLRGVTFQWLDPGSQGGITGTQMGLIADEVQRAFPQWVGRDAKGYQTLTVSGFEALTAEALRELRAEKDREIAELKQHNRQLEARITILERILANDGSSPSQLQP